MDLKNCDYDDGIRLVHGLILPHSFVINDFCFNFVIFCERYRVPNHPELSTLQTSISQTATTQSENTSLS